MDSELRCEEEGSITIVTITLTIVILFTTVIAILFSQLVVGQRHTQSAADASAIAGANALALNADTACLSAAQIALRNHSRISNCVVGDTDVRVWISNSIDVAGLVVELTAQARAGVN